jgi:hypothetical protein
MHLMLYPDVWCGYCSYTLEQNATEQLYTQIALVGDNYRNITPRDIFLYTNKLCKTNILATNIATVRNFLVTCSKFIKVGSCRLQIFITMSYYSLYNYSIILPPILLSKKGDTQETSLCLSEEFFVRFFKPFKHFVRIPGRGVVLTQIPHLHTISGRVKRD